MINDMKKIVLCYLLCCFVSIGVVAQNSVLSIDAAPAIEQLFDKYKRVTRNKEYIEGYRLQVAQKSKSEEAYQIKAEVQKYVNYPVFVIYQQPNFKVRVGNFRDRYSAHYASKEIKKHFESVFIVPEKLLFSDL